MTMITRKAANLMFLRAAMIIACSWTGSWTAAAIDRPGEETVLTCRIEGPGRVASISLADSRAIYRYGRPEEPELVLSSPLADLDYRR